jgi:hypothetical protein
MTSTTPENMNDPAIIFADQITTLQNQLRYYQNYFVATQSKEGEDRQKVLKKRGQLFMQEVHFLAVTSLTALEEANVLNAEMTNEVLTLRARNEELTNQLDEANLDCEKLEMDLEQAKVDLERQKSKTFTQRVEERLASMGRHPAGKSRLEAMKDEVRKSHPMLNERLITRIAEARLKEPTGPARIVDPNERVQVTPSRVTTLPFGAPKTPEQREQEMTQYWEKHRTHRPRTSGPLTMEKGDKADQRLAEAMNQCRPGQNLYLVTIDRYQKGEAIGLHLVAECSEGFTSRVIGLWSPKKAEEAVEFFNNFDTAKAPHEYDAFSCQSVALREYVRGQVIPLEWKRQDDAFMDQFVTVYFGVNPEQATWPTGVLAPK